MRTRNYLILLACLLVAFPVVAQEDTESEEDTSMALVDAVREADARQVSSLLDDGADASTLTDTELPVLAYAAMKGEQDIAEALIGAGADLNAKDRAGATPLMYAAQFGHNEVLAALIEAGADINATDNIGWTPLIRAAVGGNAEGAQALLDAGADKSKADFFDRTASTIAQGRGSQEVIDILSN